MSDELTVVRKVERFVSDNKRVITRFFCPWDAARIERIVERILVLPEGKRDALLEHIVADFSRRHRNFGNIIRDNYDQLLLNLSRNKEEGNSILEKLSETGTGSISPQTRLLIGSYCTNEYSVESAAFFNPSIVPHPDQSGLSDDSVRFVLCFRAVGEGHISSVVFRTGVIDGNGEVSLNPVSRFVQTPEVVKDPFYDKDLFLLKLKDLGFHNFSTGAVLGRLPRRFSYMELQKSIEAAQEADEGDMDTESIRTIRWLSDSNYELRFDPDLPTSECVIFPVSANERNGIEDARFVRFVDDDGAATYYATYTAFNGVTTMPQMIETPDFRNFSIHTLNGDAARNKGMALFPRRVDGYYVMLTRHDGENLYVAKSENAHFWYDAEVIQEPREAWDLVQLGNCGSPIETDAGWLVLTHGMGPMRQYCIGAILLDRDDPFKVLGRLKEPLLSPYEVEREGYVPNVLYSCGAMVHNGDLILPYAMSDTSSGIATVDMKSLLSALVKAGP